MCWDNEGEAHGIEDGFRCHHLGKLSTVSEPAGTCVSSVLAAFATKAGNPFKNHSAPATFAPLTRMGFPILKNANTVFLIRELDD